jgi:(p)ppGpp synthase/HD superfamily hydrolase
MAMKPEFKAELSVKAKTLTQAIEDIKKEIMAWGGSIETINTLESNGKIQEISMKIKFKVH